MHAEPREQIINFLRDNKSVILAGNFDKLYENAINSDNLNPLTISAILIECGINPLNLISKTYKFMFFSLDCKGTRDRQAFEDVMLINGTEVHIPGSINEISVDTCIPAAGQFDHSKEYKVYVEPGVTTIKLGGIVFSAPGELHLPRGCTVEDLGIDLSSLRRGCVKIYRYRADCKGNAYSGILKSSSPDTSTWGAAVTLLD